MFGTYQAEDEAVRVGIVSTGTEKLITLQLHFFAAIQYFATVESA